MAQLISVKLARFDGSPWGFRLQGGKDFGTPLIVQKVNGGSPAEQAGLRAGDAVIRVNTTDMFNLRHKDAQDVMVRSGNSFEMTVQRGGSTWRPSVSPVTASIPSPQPNAPAACISPVTKTSLAAKKQDAPLIGSGHNFAPKPFLNGNNEAGPIKSIVNKQYNSPVGIYSEETIAETLSAQAEVLAGGVLGVNFKKNEKNYTPQNSEVFKMVQEADKEPRSPEPAELPINSGVITPSSPAIAGLRSVSAPETKPQPTTPQSSLPPGQNICADCERLIVGVFVRIKEKNLHVECFKCSTCGTSLKNVGYYNINNKLYCDIHAKLVARQQAPSGLSPITLPPGSKAPAGTISAALASLGGGAPLSPSLNTLGSPQPFSARNDRQWRPDDYCTVSTPSQRDLSYNSSMNGNETSTNGTNNYDERDSYAKQKSCNGKTYTSTITFRTGSEVGRCLSDRVNELFHLDDNRNPTNSLYVSSDNNIVKSSSYSSSSNSSSSSSSSPPPTTSLRNGNNESLFIDYEPSIGSKEDDHSHQKREPVVVNTCGVARYQVTNQRLKSGSSSSYQHPLNNVNLTSTISLRTKGCNGSVTEDPEIQLDNDHYRSYVIQPNLTSYGTCLARPNDEGYDNRIDRVTISPTNDYPTKSSENFIKNKRVISGYRSMNAHSNFRNQSTNDSQSLIVPDSLTLVPKQGSSPPPPPPSLSTVTSTALLSSVSSSWPNRLGTPPVDTPSFRPVQNNISGPKPFGGTSVVGPPSSFVAPPAQPQQPPSNNFGSNTLPRPASSQTVTERYYEDSDYYEGIEEFSSSRCEQQQQQQPICTSVKNKSLVWPPVKQIEDITYPTASPIWIDPNPVLDKRPRHNVREKRTSLREAASSRCGSRCSSRCCSRHEERDYERYSSTGSRINYRESSMDRASCSQPFYRKVETSETRRECRAPVYTARPNSADGLRRSLTPTRISQPVPRPWMATVISGTNAYCHVEPPPQPEPQIICRQVCQCRIVCERTSGSQHEQQHTYRQVSCELCQPPAPPPEQPCCLYSAPQEPEPQELERETDNEVVDLSKVVPPDVAICPKGVENQHNLFTETMEKDVGDIHIKKTTIYEKTVQLLSPERGRSPEPEPEEAEEEPRRVTSEEETVQRSSVTLDREVENISDRKTVSESMQALSSAIDTAQMMESTRKEEEEKRREYEIVCREEVERLRREEQECQEQQRRYEEERARRIEKKRVAFGGELRQTCQGIRETCKPEACYAREEYVESSCASQPEPQPYQELTEEIKIQENFEQLEAERRQSLREQVDVHQCIREQQQQPAPEKRQSLQERRLCARFRDTPIEREERLAQAQPQATPQPQPQETCQRKHVQFVTEETETSTRACPQMATKNTTAKEWKSDMVRALTTAPENTYSTFTDTNVCQRQQQESNETAARTIYSTEVRYEETRKPCPRPAPPPQVYERPVSPFQSALMTAPERPYTPLGNQSGEGFDTVICVERAQTPVDSISREGYCHPAEILYTDDKTREARSRERNLRKLDGPQPLPIPPQDHRLRDSSASPARSLSRPGTPKDRSLMTGLKKPGTIPSYQRYLVSMEHDSVESLPYLPSRSPTPCRTKSPAQGPPEPPACYARAQAPRIRESSPPPSMPSRIVTSTTFVPQPEHREYASYHVEEDTSSGHVAQAYHGGRNSYYSEDSRCERQVESSITALKTQNQQVDTPSCGIGKVNRVQPSLACPLAHCSESPRFPKTGVRVLPPCPPPTSCPSQSYETRRYCHEERTNSFSSSQRGGQQGDTNCSSSGVTIMPCKTTSNSGTKAGIVIMPCEGSNDNSCSRGGICVTPTFDRSGVCVSPVTHGKSSTKGSGSRSGGCNIDIGNCPASGVRVAACSDGSVCVAPCSIPGFAPVQCPKPILKSPCPRLPFPQIPMPCDTEQSCPSTTNSCDACPLNKNQSTAAANDQSFQPIRDQQPRTNLSNQLTRLTLKRDKQHVVQLFKPQPQCQSSSQCLITDSYCENKTKTLYNAAQSPGPKCDTRKKADPPYLSSQPDLGSGIGGPGGPGGKNCKFAGSSAPKRGRGILNQAGGPGSRQALCGHCNAHVRGPFITALGQIWCPDHFVCVNSQCRRALQDIGFVEEKGQLHCEYCFERFIAPACNKCNSKIKGDCLNAVGKHFHPECFNCSYCGKLFGSNPFFLEEGLPYCEADWNELFTTKCYACGFPVEAGDRWVEALNNNYHSQCFNCTMCKKNLEGQSFYAKGGRPFCKNHAR